MRYRAHNLSIFFNRRLVFHAALLFVLVLAGPAKGELPIDIERAPTGGDHLLYSQNVIWTLGHVLSRRSVELVHYPCELTSVMVNSTSAPLFDEEVHRGAHPFNLVFSLYIVLRLENGTREIVGINNRMLGETSPHYVFTDDAGISFQFAFNKERTQVIRIKKTDLRGNILFDCGFTDEGAS